MNGSIRNYRFAQIGAPVNATYPLPRENYLPRDARKDPFIGGFEKSKLCPQNTNRYIRARALIDGQRVAPEKVAKMIRYPETVYFRFILNSPRNVSIRTRLVTYHREQIPVNYGASIPGGQTLSVMPKDINKPLESTRELGTDIVYPKNTNIPNPEFAYVFCRVELIRGSGPWSCGPVSLEVKFKHSETVASYLPEYLTRDRSSDAGFIAKRGDLKRASMDDPELQRRYFMMTQGSVYQKPSDYVNLVVFGGASGDGSEPRTILFTEFAFPAPPGWAKL